MLQHLYAQLPDFARPDNPLLRQVLSRGTRPPRRVQALRIVLDGLLLILFVILLIPGWQAVLGISYPSRDASGFLGSVFLALYWPLVLAQIVMRIFSLTSTSSVIASETERGTWDTLKVTSEGAILMMKTRWAAVFYRLRVLLIALVALRLLFIVGALIDLSSFQGHYLDLLMSGTQPFGSPNVSSTASTVLGILLTSVGMVASLLAPFTAVAFDASVGMLLGTLWRGRRMGVLGQFLLVMVRLLMTGCALVLGALFVFGPARLGSPAPGDNATTAVVAWLAAFFAIGEGDVSLALVHLPLVEQLWANVDYGVLVGLALLGYTLLQFALANRLVRWAAHRAARADIT
jgi:hypothetical protein